MARDAHESCSPGAERLTRPPHQALHSTNPSPAEPSAISSGSQTPASFLAQVQADGGGGQKPSNTPALLPAVYPPQSGVQLWDFSPAAPGGISCCPCPRTARGSSPGGSRKRSCVQIGSETLNAQPRPRPLLAHACVSNMRVYACIFPVVLSHALSPGVALDYCKGHRSVGSLTRAIKAVNKEGEGAGLEEAQPVLLGGYTYSLPHGAARPSRGQPRTSRIHPQSTV